MFTAGTRRSVRAQNSRTPLESRNMIRSASLLLGCLWLASCSTLPAQFTEPLPEMPSLAAASAAPQQAIGERVRWRGVFLSVSQYQDEQWLELVDEPYSATHRRFYARLRDAQLASIKPGEEMTVVGVLGQPLVQRNAAGEREYPVIEVPDIEHLLWHPQPPAQGFVINQGFGAYWIIGDFPWHRCHVRPGGFMDCY
jgi:starvation-inducible outer membrane lipoprotein